MKKILYVLLAMLFINSANAAEFLSLPFHKIKDGSKIMVENYSWTNKVSRKETDCLVKYGSELVSRNGDYEVSTGCDYLFLENGRLFGYSSSTLKFYEFIANDNIITRTLNEDEISQLLPKFKIIKISDFANATNVYKFQKTKGSQNLLILNDTEDYFTNYGFNSNNAKFDLYEINNAIKVAKKGMIQFSAKGLDSKGSPWFILLVR